MVNSLIVHSSNIWVWFHKETIVLDVGITTDKRKNKVPITANLTYNEWINKLFLGGQNRQEQTE